MRFLFITIYTLGLIGVFFSILGEGKTGVPLVSLVCQLSDLPVEQSEKKKEYERLASKASVESRLSHQRWRYLGVGISLIGLIGCMMPGGSGKNSVSKPPVDAL